LAIYFLTREENMSKKYFTIIVAVGVLCLLFISCATAKPVPFNATQEQLAQINAENIAATATNTSTLAIIQIASLIISFVGGLFVGAGY
jgi:tetrahydromethanopterin S-methyltransferase subunit C